MFLFLCCNVNIAHKPNSHTVVNKGQKVLQSSPQLLKSCYCNLVLPTQNLSVVKNKTHYIGVFVEANGREDLS